MLELRYDREKNSTILIVGDLSVVDTEYVNVEFRNIITDEIHYTTKLYSNMWTNWVGAELITDVLVYSDKNELIKNFKWDVTMYGDKIEKTLWYYLLNRKKSGLKSNGLVIGTHDGRNGHWIYPIKENLSNATLVDGGETQFEKLKNNYSKLDNVEMFNHIVTTDGGEVTWYKGGEGYTDTVVPELIMDWLTDTEITKITKDSKAIKDFFKTKNYDWLHLDVEGIDAKLILSLEERPNIIIYESMNLSEEENSELSSWFNSNNYETTVDNGNTIAIKKKVKEVSSKKKIVLLSTFCDTERKINVLKDNLKKLRELNLDVMIISPNFLPVDEEIVKLCDFVFYTKENPLLEYPVRQYSHWYEKQISDNRVITFHRGFADYGWAALYQTKKLSQIALTFDYDLFYHLIYDVEIDDILVGELLSDNANIIHPRRNPNHPEEIWETTLHFMVFDREMMKKIENEITLDEYLSTNGVAEGEVLKWTKKFDLKISEHCVKDKIFYWENFEFFNISPYPDFKMFVSKNPELQIWLGYDNPYPEQLSENLKIVFYEISENFEIEIIIDGQKHKIRPVEWEYVEFPIDSQRIKEIKFVYKNVEVDFSKKYSEIMMNQVFYNFRN